VVSSRQSSSRASILLVEDEAIVALTLKRALELAHYTVSQVVSRGAEVAGAVSRHEPDVVVMDISLADDVTGLEAAREIRCFCECPIIFVTGYPEERVRGALKDLPATALLTKPVPPAAVVETIERMSSTG
jgi:CheY-like chemotaxis protein